MGSINKLTMAAAAVGVASLVGSASAEERSGIQVRIGGGMEDFVGHTMRHASNANGMWGVHTAVDVQRYVTLEAGYLGTAAKVNAPLGNTSATLVGTTFEALSRLSPLPDQNFQPYAFFGAAWRHYDVAGEDFTTSDSGMADSDDLFQLPVGAGVAYRYKSAIADARVTYRTSVEENLVRERDGGYATMDSWGISGSFGYQF